MNKNCLDVSLYQLMIGLSLFVSAFLGFVIAWLLFETSKLQKRPGINIKEF